MIVHSFVLRTYAVPCLGSNVHSFVLGMFVIVLVFTFFILKSLT